MGSFLHLLFQLRIELFQLPVKHLQFAVTCLEGRCWRFWSSGRAAPCQQHLAAFE